jgi:hypothetical protein
MPKANTKDYLVALTLTIGILLAIIIGCMTFIRGIDASDFSVKVKKDSRIPTCECKCFYK